MHSAHGIYQEICGSYIRATSAKQGEECGSWSLGDGRPDGHSTAAHAYEGFEARSFWI